MAANHFQNETARLAALHGYRQLDTPSEPEFDAIVRRAATAFGTPIALIALVDEDRNWFKAKVGLNWTEAPRCTSFCQHALIGRDVFVVEDALLDPRFVDNPNVTGGLCVRFYAGVPLVTAGGWRVGTLCVVDTVPHPPIPAESAELLRVLAERTVAAFERRKAQRAAARAA